MEAPDPNDGLKACSRCGEEYPATLDYYDKDASKQDGMRPVCKVCRAKEREETEKRKIDDRLKMLDTASLNLLDRLATGGSDVPHLVELYQRILEAFDGAGGLAQHYLANYLTAKPGSAIREKMLGTIIRMGTKVTDGGMAQIPVELLNDEDLQREIDSRARRILGVVDEHGEVKKVS